MSYKKNILTIALVGLTVFFLGALFIFMFEKYMLSQTRALALQHSNRFVTELRQNLYQGIGATSALSAIVKQGNGSVRDFNGIARELIAMNPSISSLQLAPNGVIQSVEPLIGNQSVIGHHLLTDEMRNKEARLALRTGKMTLAGPFELIQGGEAVVGRLPVFLGGKESRFWGFTTSVMKMADLLQSSGLDNLHLQGYDYVLWRIDPNNGKRHVLAKSKTFFSEDSITNRIEVPNGFWFLSLAPTVGWLNFSRIFSEGILLLLLTIAATWAVSMHLRNKLALIKSEANLRISSLAFESQVGVVVTDASGVILKANHTFADASGYSVEELTGKTPLILKSSLHGEDFYASIRESLELNGFWEGEILSRHKSGENYLNRLNISVIKDNSGVITHYLGTQDDITKRKEVEAQITSLSFYDPLTKLANRRLLMDRLNQITASNKRTKHDAALLLIDLDDFKTLNDTRGHDYGDILLQQVAQRLTLCVREEDTVARLGGDEFVVMLNNLSANMKEAVIQAEGVGNKIMTAINKPYLIGKYEHHITASIGVTLMQVNNNSFENLLKMADICMYQAKAAGRNTMVFFNPKMQVNVKARLDLSNDLREAVSKNHFLIHYQPQIYKGRTIGAEALLRWHHQKHGWVGPKDFIPLAEETGVILQLGNWVIETACTQLALWAAQPAMAHLTISVNVSAHQFYRTDFTSQVLRILKATGANPKLFKIELTETIMVQNVEDVVAKMTALKEVGVGFSLDDFGIGYSSLSYLKRMPLDQLKIDQSFVRDIHINPTDASICKAIVALAKSLGLNVIAEGVETKLQMDLLKGIGCHAYQGYFFSPAISLESFEKYVCR